MIPGPLGVFGRLKDCRVHPGSVPGTRSKYNVCVTMAANLGYDLLQTVITTIRDSTDLLPVSLKPYQLPIPTSSSEPNWVGVPYNGMLPAPQVRSQWLLLPVQPAPILSSQPRLYPLFHCLPLKTAPRRLVLRPP